MAHFSCIPTPEATEVTDDVQRLLDELASTLPQDQRAQSGECRPALDVLETDRHLEITVDVPGLTAAAIRVAFRGGVLLVVGEKAPPRTTQAQAYHLVEREFGRFVRAVRLTGAFDVGSAHARVTGGELTVVFPKITDRRGQVRDILVGDGSTP